MKYLIVENSSQLIQIEDNLREATSIKSCGINKDWGWFIEEDGIATYNGVDYEVKKGDYIMTMYTSDPQNNKFTIIRNADLYQNYLDIKEAKRKRDEEYKAKYESGSYNNCDACIKE